MKNYFIISFFLTTSAIAQTQRDTLWFDSSSGNYIIQYIGENDTLVRAVFEPATKINPSITVKLEHLAGGDTLIYRYAIQNGKDSKQNLLYFELEYYAEVFDASTNHWSVGKVQEGKVVQNRWVTSDAGRWLWSGDQGLEPTWHTDGFALKSIGLPGVVNSYFQGLTQEYGTPDGGPFSDLHLEILKLMDFPVNYVARKTIGPILPPIPLVALTFLDTLISYKHQAATLGWLREKKEDEKENDDGELKELDKRLDDARKALVKGDSSKTRKELEKFVEKVEEIYKESVKAEEKKKEQEIVMTSEAYALLKFNAEYLIDRLPKKKK